MQRLTPAALAQAYRDPVSWIVLAVDLFPIVAIFQFGWGAAALVMLYWLENLVIGLVTLLRIFAAAAGNGASAIVGAIVFGGFFAFQSEVMDDGGLKNGSNELPHSSGVVVVGSELEAMVS